MDLRFSPEENAFRNELRTALTTSHTSGPPTRRARRPAGPSRKTTSGWSWLRSASSTSRLVADDALSPGWVATNRASRRATSSSNRTEDGVAMPTSYYNVVSPGTSSSCRSVVRQGARVMTRTPSLTFQLATPRPARP